MTPSEPRLCEYRLEARFAQTEQAWNVVAYFAGSCCTLIHQCIDDKKDDDDGDRRSIDDGDDGAHDVRNAMTTTPTTLRHFLS